MQPSLSQDPEQELRNKNSGTRTPEHEPETASSGSPAAQPMITWRNVLQFGIATILVIWLGVLCSQAVAIFIGPSFFAPRTPQQPVELVEPVVTLPNAAAGSVVEHEFTLKNFTSNDVEVTNVHHPCGCTTSKISGKVVPANGTLPIKVTATTSLPAGSKRYGCHVHLGTTPPTTCTAIIAVDVAAPDRSE